MDLLQQLDRFASFARQRLNGGDQPSDLGELFEEWRGVQPAEVVRSEDLAALNDALVDFDRGDRGVPVDEVVAALRSDSSAV